MPKYGFNNKRMSIHSAVRNKLKRNLLNSLNRKLDTKDDIDKKKDDEARAAAGLPSNNPSNSGSGGSSNSGKETPNKNEIIDGDDDEEEDDEDSGSTSVKARQITKITKGHNTFVRIGQDKSYQNAGRNAGRNAFRGLNNKTNVRTKKGKVNVSNPIVFGGSYPFRSIFNPFDQEEDEQEEKPTKPTKPTKQDDRPINDSYIPPNKDNPKKEDERPRARKGMRVGQYKSGSKAIKPPKLNPSPIKANTPPSILKKTIKEEKGVRALIPPKKNPTVPLRFKNGPKKKKR